MTFYCHSATNSSIVNSRFIESNKIKFLGSVNIDLMIVRDVSSLNKADTMIDFSGNNIFFRRDSMEFDKDRSVFESFESLNDIRRKKG